MIAFSGVVLPLAVGVTDDNNENQKSTWPVSRSAVVPKHVRCKHQCIQTVGNNDEFESFGFGV